MFKGSSSEKFAEMTKFEIDRPMWVPRQGPVGNDCGLYVVKMMETPNERFTAWTDAESLRLRNEWVVSMWRHKVNDRNVPSVMG
jgi:hypothetical protein